MENSAMIIFSIHMHPERGKSGQRLSTSTPCACIYVHVEAAEHILLLGGGGGEEGGRWQLGLHPST